MSWSKTLLSVFVTKDDIEKMSSPRLNLFSHCYVFIHFNLLFIICFFVLTFSLLLVRPFFYLILSVPYCAWLYIVFHISCLSHEKKETYGFLLNGGMVSLTVRITCSSVQSTKQIRRNIQFILKSFAKRIM